MPVENEPGETVRPADELSDEKKAGLNAHLSKPVEPEILFETLQKLILT